VRFRTLLIGAGWVTLLAGFTVWVTATDGVLLRDQLRRWQFWFLEIPFPLLVALTVVNLRACVRAVRLSSADYAVLAGTMALALVLAGLAAPLTNRIYYDEQIYQGIAQNLADLRLAQMCNDGTVEYGQLQCWGGEYNKQPYGYPYVLSLAYRLFGVSYWTAPRVNLACLAALVGLVFLLAARLFDDLRVARLAALVSALIPEQLRWSHTAASEPSAAAAGALAVLAAVHFSRTRSHIALAWTVVATAFALQFRTESILAAVVVAGVIAFKAPSEFRRRRLWGWTLVGAALSAAALAHLFAIRQEGWGAAGDKLSLQFVAANLRANGWFYLADARFPALYTLLALAALVAWRERKATLLAAGYFGLFAGIYLLFYAGSYNYGADVRFALMTFPPLALLAGAGAAILAVSLQRTGLAVRQAELLVAAMLAFQFLGYMPLVRSVGEEAWAARADVSFSERFAPRLPANSIVLTHNPSVFHVMGRNAAQLSLLTVNPAYVTDVLLPRYRGGVFVHWNFWCNVSDPVQQQFCATALAQFPHTLAGEYRERDYRFAFYRLEEAAAATPVNRGHASLSP
jgi:4-amino-4-deoxy-L-arabinose transferase-like glycosyltransferase